MAHAHEGGTEPGPADTVDEDAARSVAAIDATDPGSIIDTERNAVAAAAVGAALAEDEPSTKESTSDEPAPAG